MTSTIRYRAAWLLIDPAVELIEDGCVDVAGGRVVWSGAAADAPARIGESVDVSGLLMPGLVNAHCHTPMVLLRGAGEGLPLERWLNEVMWPREARLTDDDVYWGMQLGAAEQLLHGVTTTCEMYFFADAMARAADEVGLRSIVAAPLIADADRFGPMDDQFSAAVSMADQWSDHDRVSIALGPHSVYATSRPVLEQVSEVATEADLAVHIHTAELAMEDGYCRENHGLDLVDYLGEIGLFNTHLIGAHGVWLDDSARDRLARHDVGLVHCPTSNTRHANGIAPVVAHRAAGIPVGLGTDGPASAPMLDLFAEMRLAMGLARVDALDAEAITPVEALTMATVDSARSLGRDDIGSLAVGRRADMISVDVSGSAYHPVVESADIITHLVWGGTPSDVTDVWVEGEQVVEEGELLTLDVIEAQAEVEARAHRLAAG